MHATFSSNGAVWQSSIREDPADKNATEALRREQPGQASKDLPSTWKYGEWL